MRLSCTILGAGSSGVNQYLRLTRVPAETERSRSLFPLPACNKVPIPLRSTVLLPRANAPKLNSESSIFILTKRSSHTSERELIPYARDEERSQISRGGQCSFGSPEPAPRTGNQASGLRQAFRAGRLLVATCE